MLSLQSSRATPTPTCEPPHDKALLAGTRKRRRTAAKADGHAAGEPHVDAPVAGPSRPLKRVKLDDTEPPAVPEPHAARTCNMDGGCAYELTFDEKAAWAHLNAHESLVKKRFMCTYPGCPNNEGKGYANKCNRNKHVMNNHWGFRFPCPVDGCNKWYGREDEVTRHRHAVHGM
ncbi:hypothetical protein BN946_scf185016.g70 [Trametes cinnabarina]|uniref:C2H2-type domain-containing protein n=1 Tax=Pycnoporus cinnabarinus TaxID=5643 RepID=A0A060SNB4_PYCCI|nr:hypothetical protein BN946_scf185016.g70 [Trametes cinnabarina]